MPAIVIEVIGKVTVPVLVTFTTLAGLTVFRARFPNARLVGDTVNAMPPLTPVPDKLTDFEPEVPPPVITIFADFAPILVGLNFTSIVQLIPIGTGDVQ